MQATTILMDEHAVIERVLTMLESVAAAGRRGEAIPADFARWSIGFLRQFADGCHHYKEEEALFPLLVSRGLPKEGGPVGVMLYEHEHGRRLVAEMEAALDERPQNNGRFADAAAQYASLLRQHIWKENNVLFQMAEQLLSPADDVKLVDQYKQAELHAPALHDRLVGEVEAWEKNLAIPVVA
ncbi:MAG TPA: hemerythrin domain-containing protein [Pirellulaceae bacterium]|nr:hemerythrin domain-containing protein [Pirellulaceae bacterium]